MHLPTYIALMVSAVLFGLYKTVILWQANWLLFTASVFITIGTVAVAILQLIKADGFELKWMLWYVIPLGLLIVSGLMQNIEFADSAMSLVDIEPPPHVIPGTSQDYKSAATGHYISMIFPFIARLFSKLVQFMIDNISRNKNS